MSLKKSDTARDFRQRFAAMAHVQKFNDFLL
jgi:hypothetical protein